METFLEVDGGKRQKKLRGKTYFLHHSNISLKVNHELDFDSCQFGVWGSIFKHVSFPRASNSQTIDDRFRFAFGIQGGDAMGPSIEVKARKKFRLVKGTSIMRGKETVNRCSDLKLGGRFSHDLKNKTWNLQLKAIATMAIFRLNRNMDVRIRGKLCLPIDEYGFKTIIPVLSMEENCWSFETDGRDWKVFYRL
eukprot:jgi/Picsp_1/6530/NSC_03873-R1_hypothetical protein CHLNCDRAFT_52218 [Chlorella variabilis]